MLHLVVARQHASLDWIEGLPDTAHVTVYNAGDSIDTTRFTPQVNVVPVPATLSNVGVFLHHLQQEPRVTSDSITVFTPEDPEHHAPAFFNLLSQHDHFEALQVLSARAAPTTTAGQRAVQGEMFSLATLAPLAHQNDASLRVGKAYRRKHGLPEDTPLLAHFFDLIGLAGLGEAARRADIGVRAHGAMVALRGDALAHAMSRLRPHLETLALLMRADRNYPDVIDLAWLHLLGQPFVTLAPLAMPQPASAPRVTTAGPSMARVVASIDAVLAQSHARPTPAPSVSAIKVPVQAAATPAGAGADAENIAVLRQRAQAAFLRGESSVAWELLHRALDDAPRDIGLLADATQMAYAQQDTERALHCARRALLVDPDHVDCLFTLGMCLAATGHAEEALAIFERLNKGELAEAWQARQQHAALPTLRQRVTEAA